MPSGVSDWSTAVHFFTRDGRALARIERSDRFFAPAYGLQEVADVRFHGLGVVAWQRHAELFARGHPLRRFAAKLLRIEVQVLAVHHFDGAFVAHELLAVTEMVVAEIATVIQVESAGILEDGAHGVGHLAVVLGPPQDRAGGRAGLRGRLAQDELRNIGLMHQQVRGDAARGIPVKRGLLNGRWGAFPRKRIQSVFCSLASAGMA